MVRTPSATTAAIMTAPDFTVQNSFAGMDALVPQTALMLAMEIASISLNLSTQAAARANVFTNVEREGFSPKSFRVYIRWGAGFECLKRVTFLCAILPAYVLFGAVALALQEFSESGGVNPLEMCIGTTCTGPDLGAWFVAVVWGATMLVVLYKGALWLTKNPAGGGHAGVDPQAEPSA